MSIIQLSDDQKQKLAELSQAGDETLVHRARLILAYAEGKPTLQAAKVAGISRGRARFWKRQFYVRGMGIFNFTSTDDKQGAEPLPPQDKPPEVSLTGNSSDEVKEETSKVLLEIDYPKPLECIGLKVDDNLAEAGRKVWLYYFAEMLSHEPGTLLGENVEELHDMRVATRRMRTAFDVFAQAYEPKIMNRYLKGLRSIGRVLGQVRDMDVILENAINYQGRLKEDARIGLQPLVDDWKQGIDKKRAKLTKHLQSVAYYDFKYKFNIFLQAPEHIEAPVIVENGTNARIRDVVPVLVYSRYAAVRAYDTILPTASVSQLHALRIEFKKFRYVLEYFREILGENVGQAITELKHLQDHLGELHDADVACQLVMDFMTEWEEDQLQKPIPERSNPETIVKYLANLHAYRHRLISSFPELWNKFSRPEFRQTIAQAISRL